MSTPVGLIASSGGARADTPKSRPKDIGYFNPDNEAEPVTHANGTRIFHDVLSLPQRLKIKAPDLEPSEIDQCLQGKAERWFTTELSEASRIGIRTSVDLCCSELEKRFQKAPTSALQKLESLRYTIGNVRARKDPEEYIQTVITPNKHYTTAGLSAKASQVMTAYNHLDVHLRMHLPVPTDRSTLALSPPIVPINIKRQRQGGM